MRPAFTLIEFLIAITIIVIVVGLSVSGYSRARMQAELELAQDRVITTLRIAQEQVRQGRLGNLRCRGVLFERGGVPRVASVPFTGSECTKTLDEQAFLPFPDSLVVSSLFSPETNMEFEKLSVFSMPPVGSFFASEVGKTFVITLGFSNRDTAQLQKKIIINTVTGTVHAL